MINPLVYNPFLDQIIHFQRELPLPNCSFQLETVELRGVGEEPGEVILVNHIPTLWINKSIPVTVPFTGTTHLNRLSQFSSFYLILSYLFRLQTMRRFSMRTHLSHALHHSQTCVCLMANLVLLKLNLILDSSFLCCAWLCCHTHAHHTCSMLLFHSATAM